MAQQSSNNNRRDPREIENRNFLSSIGFKLVISRLRGVTFFLTSANVPTISMNTPTQGTRFNKVPQPGDELRYEDLRVTFKVDENLKNYYQVHDWMRGITTPVDDRDFNYKRGTIEAPNTPEPYALGEADRQWMSDMSLLIQSSNYQTVSEFIFKDAFPVSLGIDRFNSQISEENYVTATMTLRYSYFDYDIKPAAQATDATMNGYLKHTEAGNTLDTNPQTAEIDTQFQLPVGATAPSPDYGGAGYSRSIDMGGSSL